MGGSINRFSVATDDYRRRNSSSFVMDSDSKVGPQIIAAFAATIGAFTLGNGLGWSSPALPNIACPTKEHPEPTLKHCLDEDEQKWTGSLLCIGALIASQLVGVVMMPRLGLKWTMISMSIPAVLGFILLILPDPLDDGESETVWLFYLGRILTGLGGGAFSLAAPAFVSEIAEPRVRGALGALMQFQVTIGILFVTALNINGAVDWVVITGICAGLPVLMVVAMFFVPDSPVFLVRKGKMDAAKKSLTWLRGKSYSGVEEEIVEIKKAEDERNAPESKVSLSEIFTQAVYLKPFGISLCLMLFQQLSGINEVLFYMNKIFEKANSTLDPSISNFIVNTMQVVATGAAVILVDKLGRRILLFASGFLMSVCIFGLGAYFYLDENHKDVSSLGWLPLTCLIIYIVGFSIGFGPLAWAMNAEMFPKEAQGPMSALATAFNWTLAFIVSAFSSDVEKAINASGLYFLFGAVNTLSMAFTIFICPETKGKTPEDMKNYFLGIKQ